MNTIPLTFDEHQISRTVIGGRKNPPENSAGISVILLNSSGSHFKIHLFENLLDCCFDSVVSVEHDSGNYSIEDISRKFPQIKFIVPLEDATDGEMINMAMSEIKSDYVLVIRDSLYIPSGIILPRLAERLTETGVYCLVPRLTDGRRNGIAMTFSPSAERSQFEVDSSAVVTDGIRTLYPFDRIGLYNRRKFIQLGGFDYSIKSAYWQNMDLALRSWLWGEETRLTTMLQFSYMDEAPVDDKTVNIDYLRYYLKNELPKFRGGKGVIRPSFFLRFMNRSSCGYFEARRQFRSAALWVEKNRFRFRMDLQMLIENWSGSE